MHASKRECVCLYLKSSLIGCFCSLNQCVFGCFFQGYFRKGEVDFAAELYSNALVSYKVSLVFCIFIEYCLLVLLEHT